MIYCRMQFPAHNLFSFTFSGHKNIFHVKHFILALQSIFHFFFQAAKTKYLIYCRMQFLALQFIFHLFFQAANTSTNFLLVLQSIFHLFFEAAKTKTCGFFAGCNLWPCSLFLFIFFRQQIHPPILYQPSNPFLIHIFRLQKEICDSLQDAISGPANFFYLFFQAANTFTNFILALQSIFI